MATPGRIRLVRALSVFVRGLRKEPAAPVAELRLVVQESRYEAALLVVPLRLSNRDGFGQASVGVVDVAGYFFRLPPRPPAVGDPESGGGFDVASELWVIRDAVNEKGTDTVSRRFKAQASFATRST